MHRRQYFQTTRLYANKAPGPSSSNHGGSVDDVSQAVSATSSRTGSRKPEVKEKEDGVELQDVLELLPGGAALAGAAGAGGGGGGGKFTGYPMLDIAISTMVGLSIGE